MPYYHVRITRKSKSYDDALELDLSEGELKKAIVDPFLKGEPFMCGGEPIDPFDVETIHINKTQSPSGILLLKIKAERAKSTGIVGIADEWYVTKEGIDVTREFITSPPKKVELSGKESRVHSKNVFIVHGRDHEPMKELKTMLYEFGLNPIVLHEQPSGSRTIVEKLEKYSDVGYAFIILTPDDIGALYETLNKIKELPLIHSTNSLLGQFRKRARQNVILEFGYFIGLLGRDRVCCLHKGDVELPSDMHGIVYIPFKDSVEETRYKIMKELQEAGYEIKL
jgi:predicted nucleotide-binding protein